MFYLVFGSDFCCIIICNNIVTIVERIVALWNDLFSIKFLNGYAKYLAGWVVGGLNLGIPYLSPIAGIGTQVISCHN